MPDLFTAQNDSAPESLGPGSYLFRGYVTAIADALIDQIRLIAQTSPFRQMKTPGGRKMSAAMTGCGTYSWITDARGYRYVDHDPATGKPWPAMPPLFLGLAQEVAGEAGYTGFEPDVCLINRYQPGARMGLHQDCDELDFRWPVVSVSLGLPAVFFWGGLRRGGSPARLGLEHGDVLVWGGEDRLRYHGIAPVADGRWEPTGHVRYNLTFRRAR